MIIRKIIILSLVITLFSIPAFSQFGVHLGSDLSYLSTKSSVYNAGSQNGHPLGFYGGIDYNKKIASNLFIQPELNYEFFHGTGLSQYSAIFEGDYKLSYLAIPVLFKYVPNKTVLGIYAGPQYSYLLSASSNGNDWKPALHKSAVSGVVGGEYAFKLKNGGSLVPSIRYLFDFTNSYATDNSGSIKNKSLIFTIGYRF